MINLNDINHIHCIGIGGIGLSAIAEILLDEGFVLSGSDMKESEVTDRLISKGANVYLGHRAKNIGDADLIIYSVAVPDSNPELTAARNAGIPCCTRAQMLGLLMDRKECSVAVSGAHGKTTTTSMISLILKNAGLDPTILVGGILSEIGGNVRVGDSSYFVTEACEYMDSFLELKPRYGIILNIDSDHLDYFKDIDHIVRSFDTFANRVRENGALIAYDANPFVSDILRKTDRRVITFGYHLGCDYGAADIRFDSDGMPSFDLFHERENLCRIRLSVPGDHNVTNALAAIACCLDMGIDTKTIAETLEKFTGTQRRFQVKGEMMNSVRIVDDYAHHPNEIAATIKAARKMRHSDLWVIFQPHTYTRTLALHDDFAEALAAADKVVLAEIYAAREVNTHQISSQSIAAKMKDSNPSKDVWYFETFDEIRDFVLKFALPGDLIITMGAGDIYKVGDSILEADREAWLG